MFESIDSPIGRWFYMTPKLLFHMFASQIFKVIDLKRKFALSSTRFQSVSVARLVCALFAASSPLGTSDGGSI